MTSEALQNPYFVRQNCIWILTKHISNYNIVDNRSFCFATDFLNEVSIFNESHYSPVNYGANQLSLPERIY